jgi:predicted protein tyrosine phosphatase
MFEIKVLGIAKAKSLIGADWPTHIVSLINDPGPDFPGTTMDRQHGNHIIENFHDVEDEENTDYVVPQRNQINGILEEVASWNLGDEDKLLVHCSAGKSRSTAIALGILCQAGMSPADALQRVKLLSPALLPNRLIVEYVDDHLKLSGTLVEVIQRYYEASVLRIPGINLPNRGGYNK